MRKDCRAFDPHSTLWREHAGSCAQCADQLLAHQSLEHALGQSPPPRLGPEFDTAVRLGVIQKGTMGALGRRHRAVMLAYWMFAAICSLVILARLPISSLAGSTVRLAVLIGVGVVLSIPLVVLGWRRRVSLSDLVISTWW